MRIIKVVLCALVCLLTLQGCAKKKETSKTEHNMDTEQKVLVAYFSATGTTRAAAERLATVMGGDIHEIKPEKPYTAADLDWTNKQSRSTIEMHDPTSRPAITGKLGNMADYDIVFVGFPIWWYTYPSIINTFMESYNFKGKTLVPFATSGGSTIEKSDADLKKVYPDLDWQKGRLLNNASNGMLESWKKELGL